MSVLSEAPRRVGQRGLPRTARPRGDVLVVASGRSGVGASTVAALLSVMAAVEGLDVLLVDADGSRASLPPMLGVTAGPPSRASMGEDARPEDLLVPLGEGLTLLPVGGAAGAGEGVTADPRTSLIRAIGGLYARFDLVIIDSGSRLDQVVHAAAGGVTRLLAVTEPHRTAISATYALVRTVDHHLGAVPIDVLVNRCRLSSARAAFEDLDSATRHFLQRSLCFAGSVPDDGRLTELSAVGGGLHQTDVRESRAAQACQELAGGVMSRLRESAVLAPVQRVAG
jgi:flagellar biosynthesis protein FlhG